MKNLCRFFVFILFSAALILLAVPAFSAVQDLNSQGQQFNYEGDAPLDNKVSLNVVQNAWNESKPSQGIKKFTYKQSNVLKISTRVYMKTSLVLPEGEIIEGWTTGDNFNFKFEQIPTRSNILQAWPIYPEADTNLQIFGKSGNIYVFYIRAYKVKSNHIPDLVVYLNDPYFPGIIKDEPKKVEVISETSTLAGEYLRKLNLPSPEKLNFDYVF